MYSVDAGTGEAWKALFAWVFARADVDWKLVDHPAPAPLAALWARDDLGAVMMCGLPFALRTPAPTLLAAPRPAPARDGGGGGDGADLVVAADAPYRSIEDTFGDRVGYTRADSMSGAVALRAYLAPYRAARGGARLYRSAVGGLDTPRGVLDAVVDGRIDVGPLDSYCHDLIRRSEPALAARVRTLATTPASPIPPIIATRPLDEGTLARVRAAFRAVESAGELAPLRERLLLSGFDLPEARDYDALARIAAEPAPSMDEL
jgi:ABC-type phosphate/phosphonate transport system substrate-binding protein